MQRSSGMVIWSKSIVTTTRLMVRESYCPHQPTTQSTSKTGEHQISTEQLPVSLSGKIALLPRACDMHFKIIDPSSPPTTMHSTIYGSQRLNPTVAHSFIFGTILPSKQYVQSSILMLCWSEFLLFQRQYRRL